ncbi:hypothetical protein PVK06_010052 [Gossypium arboreum]|uniref:Uncharacterized protein n=1 Tax=Gossypium arboreum TaxID=29729 RepID=A0ABR0QQ87_GOSAR|nr:hypothetical protein PVK06_010052 [Gossypium arboreum]
MRKGKQGSFSCFLCDGLYRVRECPRRTRLSIIVKFYEESKAKVNFNEGFNYELARESRNHSVQAI